MTCDNCLDGKHVMCVEHWGCGQHPSGHDCECHLKGHHDSSDSSKGAK